MTRVSLIEDDPVFRDAVLKTLANAPGCRLLDACADAATALAALAARPPDVALVDIHLGATSGVALVAELVPRLRSTAFLMLTAEDGDELIFEALKAGAVGYLLKHAAGPDLLATTTAGIFGFDPAALVLDLTSFGGSWSAASGTWSVALANAGHDLVLDYLVSVPEPATCAALAGFGVLALAAWRRRHRRPDGPALATASEAK
jgi:MYXO-CTERM domain-containing protein